MSIYDGLTAGKPAVVVDFGARYTKYVNLLLWLK